MRIETTRHGKVILVPTHLSVISVRNLSSLLAFLFGSLHFQNHPSQTNLLHARARTTTPSSTFLPILQPLLLSAKTSNTS